MNPIESSLNIYQRYVKFILFNFIPLSINITFKRSTEWQTLTKTFKYKTEQMLYLFSYSFVGRAGLCFVCFHFIQCISWQRNWLSLKFDNSYCSCSWLAKFLFDYVLGGKPTTLTCSCNIDCRGFLQVTVFYIKYFLGWEPTNANVLLRYWCFYKMFWMLLQINR